MENLKLRGRLFSISDLELIKKISETHFEKGRTFISKKVCEQLNWKQPNGWLKDRACREVLNKLESLEIIKLPTPRIKKNIKPKQKKSVLFQFNNDSDLSGKIELRFAKGNACELVWNELVRQYHYLGHSVLVGKCIKYLIYCDEILVGAISFSSPAKNVGIRNELLNSLGIVYNEIEKLVINNSRFLILPHIRKANLASKILAHSTKKIVDDWKWYYSETPLIVETFVQISKFQGTCYKAANWKYIGETKGFSKKGDIYYANNEPKYIFIYGLNKRIRQDLTVFF